MTDYSGLTLELTMDRVLRVLNMYSEKGMVHTHPVPRNIELIIQEYTQGQIDRALREQLLANQGQKEQELHQEMVEVYRLKQVVGSFNKREESTKSPDQ